MDSHCRQQELLLGSVSMKLTDFEERLYQKISLITAGEDPAHDLLHIQRVVATAIALGAEEKAKMEVVVPATWLRDLSRDRSS